VQKTEANDQNSTSVNNIVSQPRNSFDFSQSLETNTLITACIMLHDLLSQQFLQLGMLYFSSLERARCLELQWRSGLKLKRG
jgi:hypothetical protein